MVIVLNSIIYRDLGEGEGLALLGSTDTDLTGEREERHSAINVSPSVKASLAGGKSVKRERNR